MKTMSLFIAGMVLLVMTSSFTGGSARKGFVASGNIPSKEISNPAPASDQLLASAGMMVRYAVTVHLAADAPICGNYWVKVVNASGNPVAQPQLYNPGQSTYFFTEKVPASGYGVRAARMTEGVIPGGVSCQNRLFTAPSSQLIYFVGGNTYPFDIFPQYNPPQNPH